MNIRKSEMNILEVLWTEGEMSASRLYRILEEKIGWKKSTTYTVISKCIEKGFVKRVEPGFICQPLIAREDVHNAKFIDILKDYYSNSRSYFLSAFVKESPLTDEEVQKLNDIVERLK